ncbi:universal stress protein [Mycobacterium rhizamassiliense]|jgi:nucleotide-binding universal stress UspA family protein|uniref:Universal stress protein n=1 Tax=Mycobacterium rhizamassiliense TaxID=1841860 RepID=A0A2U3NL57_9MYCO|nr:universal stress protein [Mycobacterium rhizamassiliense]SPM32269.1 universal stress protein [Mycobacterium rhizamassiliense]
MTKPATKYGVLVGVDGSVGSDAAVRFAAREAMLRRAPLTLLHVVFPAPDWVTASRQLEIAAAREENAHYVLERARKTAAAAIGESALLDVHTEVVYSTVASIFIGASSGAQMVVVGCRGTGVLGRLVLGSVSGAMAHHAHCPVAVIHDDDRSAASDAPVLVGVDGSPASKGAIELAFDEASRRRVQLVALHAWSDDGVFPTLGMDWRKYETQGAQLLAERLARWQAQFPDVQVQRRVVCGKPAQWLIDESQRAQLVVVGSHESGGFPGMLWGSVSFALAHSTRTPLIIHRPGGANELSRQRTPVRSDILHLHA